LLDYPSLLPVYHNNSTGVPGQIHISQQTAQLLHKAGRSGWCTARPEKIVAKGKGEIQTYWLTIPEEPLDNNRITRVNNNNISRPDRLNQEKVSRLVQWVTDGLGRILKQIHGQRQAAAASGRSQRSSSYRRDFGAVSRHGGGSVTAAATTTSLTVLDEVQEIIHMPSFNGQPVIDPDDVELDHEVTGQLECYVAKIASMCTLYILFLL
jgi:Adenylate and Guanylate cyclase catalytic domain